MGYFHLVFIVPHELIPLIWQNKKVLFTLLFESSAATLLEVAADPKHLGTDIGFLSILHTWGQTLPAPAHPLRRTRRRTFVYHTLDLVPSPFLLTGQGAQPCLSWKFWLDCAAPSAANG